MATSEAPLSSVSPAADRRPKRADAKRNYDKVVRAAQEAFAQSGTSTSLEDIARRAGVGIGTLYRNFPNRQSLLEAVYLGEVDDLSQSAKEFAELPPWEALSGWLRRFVAYLATKQALVSEMLQYMDRSAPLFQECRTLMYGAGEPLLRRAQEAGVVRQDIALSEVIQLLMGIANLPATEPDTVERLLTVALDGLRYRPDAAQH
ncbi:MAG TPA: TetR/AcrR family transcriptional regulator [Solirubrobacteraceae bacterium]|nr:TetR/AcrR family transcriptional regulator [Solirubrobacteraceae bacterium]